MFCGTKLHKSITNINFNRCDNMKLLSQINNQRQDYYMTHGVYPKTINLPPGCALILINEMVDLSPHDDELKKLLSNQNESECAEFINGSSLTICGIKIKVDTNNPLLN